MQHTNMVSVCGDTASAYAAFKRDNKRDQRTLLILDIIVGAALAYLVHDHDVPKAVAIFVGVFGALSGLRMFIDLSNRNFLMHQIDWDYGARQERREGPK